MKQKTNICRSNLRGHQSFRRTKKYHTDMDSGNNYSSYSSKSAECASERELCVRVRDRERRKTEREATNTLSILIKKRSPTFRSHQSCLFFPPDRRGAVRPRRHEAMPSVMSPLHSRDEFSQFNANLQISR